MTSRHVARSRLRAPRHARTLRTHRVARGAAIVTSSVLMFGAASAAAFVQHLQSNVERIDVAGLIGPAPVQDDTPPPDPSDPSAGRPLNVLVLGSDYRDEAAMAAEGKRTAGMRADTTMVVHVSADRQRVEVVSIPRDSLVKIPSCEMTNGATTRAQSSSMINNAFAIGWDNGGDLASAAACAGRTVQENTGLTIDHFVVVDFNGFQSMIDAIGGVDICIPVDLHDPYTGLKLSAGQQRLEGETAFKFARARHGNVGDGTDIARIGNQQRLVAAIVDEVLSRDVLGSPPRLVSFLDAATQSLTVDSGLDITTLTGLAFSAKSIEPSNIVLMTVPWAPAKSDPNRVQWTSAATTLWQNMANDVPIVETPEPPPASQTTDPAAPPAPDPTSDPAVPPAPTPEQTKQAGKEAFTPADVTAVCS